MDRAALAAPSLAWIIPTFVVALLVCVTLSGLISALSNYLRLSREGLLKADMRWRPWSRLSTHPRSVYLTLSLSCLLALITAAAAYAAGCARLIASASLGGWVVAWVAFMVAVLLLSIGVRSLALAHPVDFTRLGTVLSLPLFVLLRPLTLMLEAALARLSPSVWAVDIFPPFSGQEILEILEETETTPHLREQERDIVRGIFDLRDTEIREIMVPRIDMVGLDVDTPLPDAIQLASRERFTRMPVWEGNQDRILGILHTKDLLWAQAQGQNPTVRQLLRPVHFLPESNKIAQALHEFRDRRVHLAVVVDEYGGTAGIVTLEDILEEIVGEIQDEFDQEGELFRVVDTHRAVIDPRIDLDDLNESLGLALPTDESDTLAGLLYSLAGKVPARGEQIAFRGLRFTVDRVDRQRIKQVTLHSPGELRALAGRGAQSKLEEEA